MSLLIYLVAGEQSGDALGARLMSALRQRVPDVAFTGIGGAEMAAEGLDSLFPMQDLALMGFLEVVPHLPLLRRRLAQTRDDIANRRPAAVITIDSPGFALRLLRSVPRGITRVHYVAPQIWAWRERRARHYHGLWDQLLCLLPFEPAFFERHNLPARFVGHPVIESGADRGDGLRFREMHDIAPDATVLIFMPGSRRTEIARLAPILGATLERLSQTRTLAPVVPLAPAVTDQVAQAVRTWHIRPILLTGQQEKYNSFAAAAAAVTKSGTSTLELAMAGVPMIVTYRVNPLSAPLVRRLITVPYASLLNLIAGSEVIPELIQQDCTPTKLATAIAGLLEGGKAEAQQEAIAPVLQALRPPGGVLPSEAAANAVLELLQQT